MAIKWNLPCQHFVADHPKTINVRLHPLVFGKWNPGFQMLEDFGGSVESCPHHTFGGFTVSERDMKESKRNQYVSGTSMVLDMPKATMMTGKLGLSVLTVTWRKVSTSTTTLRTLSKTSFTGPSTPFTVACTDLPPPDPSTRRCRCRCRSPSSLPAFGH